MTQAYPLAYPHWVRRTPARSRLKATFRANEKPMTVATARDRLQKQLDLLGATNPVLSTNVELRLDGQPRSNRPEPDDVGVAIYFSLRGKQLCMPCDRWLTVADNITAIAQHIDATRRGRLKPTTTRPARHRIAAPKTITA